MATTEAGLLPLYSGWTSVDAWGLNDAWIAHHGAITAEYLDRYKPELIIFHAYFSPIIPPRLTEKNLAQDWFRMTIALKDYAESHHYILAAAFGDSPYETHYYYVRPDFSDSDRIVHALERCTIFMAVGTSGVVEPAASFVAQVGGAARTIYVGPEEPANAAAFTECHLAKAGEVLPDLLGQRCAS